MQKRDKIAVLIPCYNEEKTISKVVKDFKRDLPGAKIYVYNNNSTDKTAELAKAAGAIVRNEYRQGKGHVIRRMFREIDAECYVMVDGDDTYSSASAKAMTDLVLDKKVDMVIGDRLSSTYFTQNKRRFHNFGNTIVRLFINILFRSNMKDIMTGYRAFSYDFVKTFPIISNGFEIETEMSIHAADKNLFIENYVIDYKDRPEGSTSKLNTYSDGISVIFTIIRLYRVYKPFAFFGLISLLLTIVAMALFIPVFASFLQTGLVERFPTLIVSGFIMIAAILSFFAGLMLQAIVYKNKQDFELSLINLHKQ